MHNQYANMARIQRKQSQTCSDTERRGNKYVYWLNYHQFRAIKMSVVVCTGAGAGGGGAGGASPELSQELVKQATVSRRRPR